MKAKSNQMSEGFFIIIFATLIVLTVFSGLGDNPETKTEPVAANTPTPETRSEPTALGPRYDSTLAEGIDFKREGYPTFLAEVSGMSGREDWGRWTDASVGRVARFRFKQPLPQKFILELSANAFGPNEGGTVIVRVGTIERTFVVPKGGARNGTYSLSFDSTNSADTLEIVPPKPTSPLELKVSSDQRKIGLGLISLKIR